MDLLRFLFRFGWVGFWFGLVGSGWVGFSFLFFFSFFLSVCLSFFHSFFLFLPLLVCLFSLLLVVVVAVVVVVVSVSAQDGIAALGKAHARSTSSLSILP